MEKIKQVFVGRYLICVLALMWTAIVNGQAFFFQSDSTNYIRAADIALYLASDKKVSTAWTDRYRQGLDSPGKGGLNTTTSGSPGAQEIVGGVNNVGAGLIMGGRSPYIGALMYLGYLTSNFWLFVLLQASVSCYLITLSLKTFELRIRKFILPIVIFLAGTTTISFYNSYLLADAFTAFGILATFVLLSRLERTRVDTILLSLILIVSATSHLTHIWIIAAMASVTFVSQLRGLIRIERRSWLIVGGSVALGLLSTQVTALATRMILGKPPQLLPLLSARFIADGPGLAFIQSGCENNRFEICKINIKYPHSDSMILFSTDPNDGYLSASPEKRALMGQQDVAFAMAVLRFDPTGQILAAVKNTWAQLTWVEYKGLNVGCWSDPMCWSSLPPSIRDQLKATPSGRNLWPETAMDLILKTTTIASLLVVALALRRCQRWSAQQRNSLYLYVGLCLTAFLVSAFLGGAVADPQYRYTARIIWLVPFLAAICVCCEVARRRGSAEVQHQTELASAASTASV